MSRANGISANTIITNLSVLFHLWGRRGAGAQGCDWRDACGSTSARRNELLFFVTFLFLRFSTKAKTRRWIPSLNTLCLLKNSAESRGRKILTLGSVCMRDSAQKWFKCYVWPYTRTWSVVDLYCLLMFLSIYKDSHSKVELIR